MKRLSAVGIGHPESPQKGLLTMFLRRGWLILFGAFLISSLAASSACQAAISFLPQVTYPTAGAFSVTTADLDGDGKIDIIAIGGQGLSILYGKGDGTFEPAVVSQQGQDLNQVIAADVNGDGRLDLVLASFST